MKPIWISLSVSAVFCLAVLGFIAEMNAQTAAMRAPPRDVPLCRPEQLAAASAKLYSTPTPTPIQKPKPFTFNGDPLPAVEHVPNGDVQDDAEAYAKKLSSFLWWRGFGHGTHKEQFEQKTWLFGALLQVAEDAGYHDMVGAHFVQLVCHYAKL